VSAFCLKVAAPSFQSVEIEFIWQATIIVYNTQTLLKTLDNITGQFLFSSQLKTQVPVQFLTSQTLQADTK